MISPRVLTSCSYYQALITAVAALAGLWVSAHVALGVLAGGVIMGFNFWAMRVLLARLFAPQSRARMFYGLLLAGKMVLAMIAIGVCLYALPVHPAGFAAGMATLFIAATLAALTTNNTAPCVGQEQ